jgi:(2Fe-2S) ferredoxin
MACVDAKIETLFNLYPQVEPKDVLDFCQSLLEGGAKIQQNILPNNK